MNPKLYRKRQFESRRLKEMKIPAKTTIAPIQSKLIKGFLETSMISRSGAPASINPGIENDAIPYEDGYSVEERNLIYEVLGKDMMPQRWNKCKQIYLDLSINAKMKTYNELGHEQPKNVKEDIVEFFKEQLQAPEP